MLVLICAQCGRQFRAYPSEVTSKNRRFCSRQCAHSHKPEQTLERFWSKVDKSGPIQAHRPELGPCWVWTAGTNSFGYGNFLLHPGKWLGAHRFSYELLVGPIPEGLELDHLCRVPQCVRDLHLEPVTHDENQRRGLNGILRTHCPSGHPFIEGNIYWHRGHRLCVACREVHRAKFDAKRRAARPRRDKLTADTVVSIRDAYAAGGVPYRVLAERYGVSISAVYSVVRGRTWKADDDAERAAIENE